MGGYHFIGIRFEDDRVELDGTKFTDCIFERIAFQYSGFGETGMSGCTMRSCQFVFTGGAGEAARQLERMYRDGGESARRVEALFRAIRTGDNLFVAARLASWEHFRTRPAAALFEVLRGFYLSGPSSRALVESFFADVQAGEVVRDSPELRAHERAEYQRLNDLLTEDSRPMLRLRISHPEWVDVDALSEGVTNLVRAMSEYHVALGGAGLRIDDARGVASASAGAGVLT